LQPLLYKGFRGYKLLFFHFSTDEKLQHYYEIINHTSKIQEDHE